MPASTSHDALFTGLVRKPELFRQQLARLQEWRAGGRIQGIVFSTWHGELEKYPGLRDELEQREITLIESGQHNLVMQGNVLHQMKALHHGLEACAPESFVLRLRPDVGGLEGWEPLVTGAVDLTIGANPALPRVFRNRICVTGTHLLYPFFMTDTQFFGRREDVRKLVHFDLKYEMIFSTIPPEQHFFAQPFLEHFPIFESYLQVMSLRLMRDRAAADQFIAAHLESPFFLRVFAVYLHVLENYFRLGVSPSAHTLPDEVAARAQSLGLADLFFPPAALPGIYHGEDVHYVSALTEAPIKALLRHGCTADAPGQHLQEYLTAARASGGFRDWSASALRPPEEVVEFQRNLPPLGAPVNHMGRIDPNRGGTTGRNFRLQWTPRFHIESSGYASGTAAATVPSGAHVGRAPKDGEALPMRMAIGQLAGRRAPISVPELMATAEELNRLLRAPNISAHIAVHRGRWSATLVPFLIWQLGEAWNTGNEAAAEILEQIYGWLTAPVPGPEATTMEPGAPRSRAGVQGELVCPG